MPLQNAMEKFFPPSMLISSHIDHCMSGKQMFTSLFRVFVDLFLYAFMKMTLNEYTLHNIAVLQK